MENVRSIFESAGTDTVWDKTNESLRDLKALLRSEE
jgi:hypothetical protein